MMWMLVRLDTFLLEMRCNSERRTILRKNALSTRWRSARLLASDTENFTSNGPSM